MWFFLVFFPIKFKNYQFLKSFEQVIFLVPKKFTYYFNPLVFFLGGTIQHCSL